MVHSCGDPLQKLWTIFSKLSLDHKMMKKWKTPKGFFAAPRIACAGAAKPLCL
jgi:hypothetical protein